MFKGPPHGIYRPIPDGRGQSNTELFKPALAHVSTSKVYLIFNMSALTRNNL